VRFTVEQRLRTDPDETARAFTDPALYERFAALAKVQGAQVLSREVEGDRVRLQVRYRFAGQLSSAARAVIDPSRLTWVDESVHDLASRRVHFTLRPDHYGERFRCRGEYRIEPTADGCRRVATIELSVSAPLVGRAVEGAIASGLREHLADEAPVVESFLRDPR